jgi:hypothetical protein
MLGKLTVSQKANEVPTVCITRLIITLSTRASQLQVFCTR